MNSIKILRNKQFNKEKLNKEKISSRIQNFNLNNKSVCIVSYAAYMKNKKYGNIIDSHDVVVRINNAFNILNYEDFGKYTDIVYIYFADGKLNLITNTYNNINNTNYNIDQIFKKHKLLCITSNKNYISYTSYNVYYGNIKIYGLTSGIMALIIIAKLKPKSLYLTGFSFNNFIYPDYEIYAHKYKKLMASRLNKTYSEWNSPHSELFEKYLVKKIINTNDNYKVDNEMINILNDIDINNLNNNIYYDKTFLENFNIIYDFINS